LIECNPRLCEMAGSTPGQLLGRSVAELVHPDDAAIIRRMRRGLLKGQVRNTTEAVRLLQGAAEITVRVSASALRDADGQTVRLVGVVEDITEVLRLEASERALHRAEAANRAKSDFLSRMSHELRTPLNAMIGFAQLLGLDREPGLVPHQREWTQQIQRAGWHLLEMINETLDLARIESGAVQLKVVPLDLAPMVAACRAMVAGQATQRPVALHEQLSPLVPGVMGDTTRLKQVLTNLLSNAIKYNRAGGSVQISSRPGAPGQIEIAITDTGLGMNEAQLQALFQPYNRLGREGSNIEGTGIGLVISKRLTELMGGTLAVSSREGVGSTFTLTLPAALGAERSAPSYTESSPAPYQHRWVHYVEDNETNIEVMRGVLAQRSQVMLRTSMLGLDGLAAIRRDRPDLILLDMHLPDISGLELLRHLKQDDSVADIPVIVVSADATPGHMEQALTLGAQHYVTKPLDVAAFLTLVDSALEAADTRWGM
ncbi:MAG: ATP-binding protein, partial [Rubrivivax sp.]|nr:ATP-binding protein [Rubrivivax sp.]